MKLCKICILFLTLFGVVSCSTNEDGIKKNDPIFASKANNLQSGTYGPFTTKSGTVKFDFKYYSETENTIEVIKIRQANTKDFFYSKNILNHTYNKSEKYMTFSYNCPLDEVLLNQGIDIFVYVNDATTGRTLTVRSCPLYPKSKHSVNIAQNKTYTVSGGLFMIPYVASSETYRERYSFYSLPATFKNEDYFLLPLDDIYFSYFHEGHAFTYSEAYLTFEDPHNLFPYVKTNKTVKIPLKLTQSGTSISISYKNKMYVNQENLIMSLTGRVGFVQTTNFYMPRGKNSEMDETSMKIVIVSAGVHDTDITIPMTYYSLNNKFGSCDNSEYCVQGEIVE